MICVFFELFEQDFSALDQDDAKRKLIFVKSFSRKIDDGCLIVGEVVTFRQCQRLRDRAKCMAVEGKGT